VGWKGKPVDWGTVKTCASLDHSDVDNANRLIAHFCRDLSVAARDKHPGGDWLTWSRRHWGFAGGEAGAMLCAQRVGDRVFLEEKVLGHTSDEERTIKSAATLAKDDDSEWAKEAWSLARKQRRNCRSVVRRANALR
jgi:putative DNA primase/helicase